MFAGGTYETIEKFGKNVSDEQARAAKVPDFVSRLKGYIHVLGPNPKAGGEESCYVLRRAILLRSMLARDAKQVVRQGVVQIDSGVLRATLLTKTYKHGARSIESIIAMRQLAGKIRFERSSLPTEAQLDVHVDGQNFLALVQRPELEGELLEQFAEAAHNVFCEALRAKGCHLGPKTGDSLKTHRLLKTYAELPEESKEENRGQVRD